MPPQQPKPTWGAVREGTEGREGGIGRNQPPPPPQQQQQQQAQRLDEAQLEKILTCADEALLRALAKSNDDDLRVSRPHASWFENGYASK